MGCVYGIPLAPFLTLDQAREISDEVKGESWGASEALSRGDSCKDPSEDWD